MSRQAIAAALARRGLTGGERLVAFSLASFAGRDGRAWPGVPAAAAQAGLSRSRYLYDRDRLVRRGLIDVEEEASGRGRSSIVALGFAAEGPWWEGEINAELFEAVLSGTRTRGPARLLLAAMAALADGDGVVHGLSNEELCAAAGLQDRTYRRARPSLVASGELVLLSGARGRGNTNVWQVRPSAAARACGPGRSSPRRVPPPRGARPLLMPGASDADATRADAVGIHADPRDGAAVVGAAGRCHVAPSISAGNGGQGRTVSGQNCPVWSGVSPVKGGQHTTLSAAENPAENPAKNPAANARAGTEPQNPRTGDPPSPPSGGSAPRSLIIWQRYITERGRRRRRMVRIDLDEVRRGLSLPTASDRDDWHRLREQLEAIVGESTFAIWLEQAELIAVDRDRRLVVAVPAVTAAWTVKRFGGLLSRCADGVGRELRFATEPEVHALGGAGRHVQQARQEVAG